MLFADDANLVYLHSHIKTFFVATNVELNTTSEFIFQKGPIEDTSPWKLHELYFAGRIIERKAL